MSMQTIEIYGVSLDVYYSYDVEHDPYGTGDSPKSHYVEIYEIEPVDSIIDIKDLLSDKVIEMIEEEIIGLECQ